MEELKSYRDSKQAELANRYVAAYREGDTKEMPAVRDEAREWNRKAVLENRPETRINLRDAIDARREGRHPMKQMKGLARELRESYGMYEQQRHEVSTTYSRPHGYSRKQKHPE